MAAGWALRCEKTHLLCSWCGLCLLLADQDVISQLLLPLLYHHGLWCSETVSPIKYFLFEVAFVIVFCHSNSRVAMTCCALSQPLPLQVQPGLCPRLTPPSMIYPSLLSSVSCPLSPPHTHVGFRLSYAPVRVRDGCMHPSSLTWLEEDRSWCVVGRGYHWLLSLASLSTCGSYLGVTVATIPDRNNSRKDLFGLVVPDQCSASWGRDSCRCVELSLFLMCLTRKQRGWDQDRTLTSSSCP